MKLKVNSIFILIFSTLTGIGSLSFAQNSPRARGNRDSVTVSSGHPGVLFDAAFYYGQSEATANPSPGNEWKTNSSVYDLKLGYRLDNDFYLGADYTARTDSTNITLTSASGGAPGAGVGYFWGSGFGVRAFYNIGETWGSYSDGSGFHVDLGYAVNLTSNFYFGFELSHRQTTFTTNTTIAGFKSWTRKETFPMLTMGFLIN